MYFAPRSAYKAFSASGSGGALTVAGGEPVNVYGIVFRAASGAVFTVTDASDTSLWTIAVAANTSTSVEIPWVADAGIKVQNSAGDGAVTVFHNSPGR